MNASPFVERLRDHAARVGTLPPVDGPAAPVAGEGAAAAGSPARPRSTVAPNQLAFWQSPVARAAINRRITGDPELGPETYFARRHGPAIVAPLRALAARERREARARARGGRRLRAPRPASTTSRAAWTSPPAASRSRCASRSASSSARSSSGSPPSRSGAVVCRSFLHRRADLEDVLDRLTALLAPGGLVFVEDFVGPARFQWTDAQLDAINRLLARLPEELLTDLAATDGRRKRSVERPDVEAWIASNPNEAVRSDEILPLLDARLQRVEVCPYGGAIFHQLFSRIMGNFAGRPELVGVLMEVDALLTDTGVLAGGLRMGSVAAAVSASPTVTDPTLSPASPPAASAPSLSSAGRTHPGAPHGAPAARAADPRPGGARRAPRDGARDRAADAAVRAPRAPSWSSARAESAAALDAAMESAGARARGRARVQAVPRAERERARGSCRPARERTRGGCPAASAERVGGGRAARRPRSCARRSAELSGRARVLITDCAAAAAARRAGRGRTATERDRARHGARTLSS